MKDKKIENYEKQVDSWKELKKRYKEEIEMGVDVDINTFLFEGCDKEIENLEKSIEQLSHDNDHADRLVLLKRSNPTEYEIHRGEIAQTKNLVLTTTDKEFAERLVDGYNNLRRRNALKEKHNTINDASF